jgi:GTP:adenosylcobinamide-phosphate guanylyltransferase
MVYDAVILAGGRICEELRAAAAYDNEAFIMIAGQPMILYVYKALRP